jgi:lysozyme family protein
MTDIAALKAKNQHRWDVMKLRPERVHAFDEVARRLCAPAAKARYVEISAATKVPWWVVAVIHEREASQNFKCQLAQGDPLDRPSRNDPAGRGPFLDHPGDTPLHDAFYRGALDALVDCAPHLAKWTDWSPGGTLTATEEMNGLGYANMGVPSAYVWSGTDQYVSGKYVADHVYRASAVDVQEGCAPLIARMMLIDSSIKFGAQAGTPPGALPAKPAKPTVAHGGAAAAGAGAVVVAAQSGIGWGWVVLIGLACAVVGYLVARLARPTMTSTPKVIAPTPVVVAAAPVPPDHVPPPPPPTTTGGTSP